MLILSYFKGILNFYTLIKYRDQLETRFSVLTSLSNVLKTFTLVAPGDNTTRMLALANLLCNQSVAQWERGSPVSQLFSSTFYLTFHTQVNILSFTSCFLAYSIHIWLSSFAALFFFPPQKPILPQENNLYLSELWLSYHSISFQQLSFYICAAALP